MKYTLANRGQMTQLRNRDSIELTNGTRTLRFRVYSDSFQRENNWTNTDLQSMFGEAYIELVRELTSTGNYHRLNGPTFSNYDEAVVLANKLFNISSPSTAVEVNNVSTTDVAVMIPVDVLADIYRNICGQWQNKAQKLVPKHDFRSGDVYTVGSWYVQKGGAVNQTIVDMNDGKNTILLTRDNKVVHTATVENLKKIRACEIDPKVTKSEGMIEVPLTPAFVKSAYAAANNHVKALLTKYVIEPYDFIKYGVGDKIGKFTVIKVGDDLVGLMNSNYKVVKTVTAPKEAKFSSKIFGDLSNL